METPSAMIVADTFPPMVGVGSHRTVGLCRRLAERGWRVTVLTARLRPDEPTDGSLLAGIPPTVRVVRATSPNFPIIAAKLVKWRRPGIEAAKGLAGSSAPGGAHCEAAPWRRVVDWLSFWLHLPDDRLGWFLPAVVAGVRNAGRHRPGVIYGSGPKWTSHVVAATLSALLDLPLVADFRDPWCGSAWRRLPSAAHRRVDELLERFVIRKACRITCAWDGIRRHLVGRYPGRAGDIVTILNGFDREQIDSAGCVHLDGSRCVLLHAGMFYGPRSPDPLLKGLRLLKERSPRQARRLVVLLLGPQTYQGQPLRDLVDRHGLNGLVRLMPPTSHQRAMAFLNGADVAVLFGQSGDDALASIPAKTYEYIGAGKPILAIGVGQEAAGLIQASGCRLWRADEPASIAAALKDVVAAHSQGRLNGRIDSDARPALTRQRMAEELESVLRAAIEMRRKR